MQKQTHFDISTALELQEEGTLHIKYSETPNFENMLRNSLVSYWRWKAEGSIKHTSSAFLGEKSQVYYDNYHESINYDDKTDTYSYRIQTDDSPEGDTWVYGKFKLVGSYLQLQILSKEFQYG